MEERITIKTDAEFKEQLRLAAKKHHMTMSAYIHHVMLVVWENQEREEK